MQIGHFSESAPYHLPYTKKQRIKKYLLPLTIYKIFSWLFEFISDPLCKLLHFLCCHLKTGRENSYPFQNQWNQMNVCVA